MKKFKKLIPALCMLLLSVAMLGTSTFAWFSMNKTVHATGMEITAKSNQVYLLIDAGEQSAETIQNNKKTTVTATNPQNGTSVYPVAHETSVTNTETADTAGNWFYYVAEKPEAPEAATGAQKNFLTDSNFSEYVVKYQYSLTLAKASSDIENATLEAAATITAKNGKIITGVKVLVTSTTSAAEFNTTNATTKQTVYMGELSSSGVVVLNVYIYLDGTDSSVYTNNFDELDGATINLDFSIKD